MLHLLNPLSCGRRLDKSSPSNHSLSLRIYPVKISGLVGRRFLVSALWASKDELDKSDNVVCGFIRCVSSLIRRLYLTCASFTSFLVDRRMLVGEPGGAILFNLASNNRFSRNNRVTPSSGGTAALRALKARPLIAFLSNTGP